MAIRRTFAGVLTGALAAGAFWSGVAPAHAAQDPDDTTFVPVSGDLIGVGSDTTQHALKLIADAWNAGGHGFRVATFAATGGGNITLPSGEIVRPNGSGSGKGRLYGANEHADVDFARSSSSLNANERNAGLQQLPFAVDTLAMAVSQSVTSNAPAALTPQQIVAIYNGDITNWSQIDATKSGVIAPKIPQAGSGTRSFFLDQLTAINGGTPPALAASVAEVQEHDDTEVKNDPNAIAPFSLGRAELLGNTLRIQQGWEVKRAVYNVVREDDLADSDVQALFGPDGFVCSDEATSLIEDAGFGQLAREDDDGVCGVATQDATTNFTLNDGDDTVATTTTLTASSSQPGEVVLSATVAAADGATAVQGTVTFREGPNTVAADVPVVAGVATTTLTGVAPGQRTYTAVFQPAEGLAASQGQASVTVAGGEAVTTTVAVTAASAAVRTVDLTATIIPAGANGTVTFREGATVVAANVPVVGGKATRRVTNVTPGRHSYTGEFIPSDTNLHRPSADTTPAAVTVRTTASINRTFPKKVKGAKAKGTVAVSLAGTTTAATGKVTIRRGSKVVGTGTLRGGKATIKVKGLVVGKNKLKVTWAGDSLAGQAVKNLKIKRTKK